VTSGDRREFWLEHSDPLLNTILPGTYVSLILNFGDLWAAGRSLPTSALLPRACIMGPFTQPRVLRVGKSVSALGAVFPATLALGVFGVTASEIVNQVIPLEDVLDRATVEGLLLSLSELSCEKRPIALRDEIVSRTRQLAMPSPIDVAPRLMRLRGGQVSIDELAKTLGLSPRHFARRFTVATGMPPKLFARVTRFQRLVHALLSTDVERWASVPSAVGFYDQAHMINDFRAFAGSAPTVFFRPHDPSVDPATIQLRGRPSEWRRRDRLA
jgi:AraC-like DNA-binding protein